MGSVFSVAHTHIVMQEEVLGGMVGVSGDIKPFRRHFILTGT